MSGNTSEKSDKSNDGIARVRLALRSHHAQTPITKTYRNTQNVRRFFKAQCGDHFKFDRPFMAWLKSGKPRIMDDAVKEWLRREVGR